MAASVRSCDFLFCWDMSHKMDTGWKWFLGEVRSVAENSSLAYTRGYTRWLIVMPMLCWWWRTEAWGLLLPFPLKVLHGGAGSFLVLRMLVPVPIQGVRPEESSQSHYCSIRKYLSVSLHKLASNQSFHLAVCFLTRWTLWAGPRWITWIPTFCIFWQVKRFGGPAMPWCRPGHLWGLWDGVLVSRGLGHSARMSHLVGKSNAPTRKQGFPWSTEK